MLFGLQTEDVWCWVCVCLSVWESGRALCQFCILYVCAAILFFFFAFTWSFAAPPSLPVPSLSVQWLDAISHSCPASALLYYLYLYSILDSLLPRLNHWPDCCGEIRLPCSSLYSEISLTLPFKAMTMQRSRTLTDDAVWNILFFFFFTSE